MKQELKKLRENILLAEEKKLNQPDYEIKNHPEKIQSKNMNKEKKQPKKRQSKSLNKVKKLHKKNKAKA